MTYKAGEWNALCDVCGFKFKSSEIKRRWDGLMVCSEDFEHDHPQKYLRVNEDRQSVPWARPRPADSFTLVCYTPGRSAYAGLATAGCSQAGNTQYPYGSFV